MEKPPSSWIVQHLAPLSEQRSREASALAPKAPKAAWEFEAPDLAKHLDDPKVEEEPRWGDWGDSIGRSGKIDGNGKETFFEKLTTAQYDGRKYGDVEI